MVAGRLLVLAAVVALDAAMIVRVVPAGRAAGWPAPWLLLLLMMCLILVRTPAAFDLR